MAGGSAAGLLWEGAAPDPQSADAGPASGLEAPGSKRLGPSVPPSSEAGVPPKKAFLKAVQPTGAGHPRPAVGQPES